MDFGVFGCPAHDQRDLDFANKYGLKVITVVKPDQNNNEFSVTDKAYTDDGYMMNSSFLNNLKSPNEFIIKSNQFFRRKKLR